MTEMGRAFVVAILNKAASCGQAELRRVWEDELGDEYRRDDDIRKHKDTLKKHMEGL